MPYTLKAGFSSRMGVGGVHRSNDIQKYLRNNMEETISWPAYLPDLSPIENIWGWLKGEVRKDMPRNVDSLKRSILNNWGRIDEDFLKPYFDSMPRRKQMVIESEGARVNY